MPANTVIRAICAALLILSFPLPATPEECFVKTEIRIKGVK
ncbi:hypothetical protein BRUCa_0898 [Brucella melitensis]|nr:conserved hypothetical protein [Brucella melitensis M28]AEW13213.1 hypothetical protein BCA52141_I0282 [Brucella canis HSK A52141]AEW17945.1 hypothetical protein BAA13334_I02529 [Brucella abortus A13334]AIB17637.1 Hypothetical protein BSSP3_I0913 [Brucella suis bv. 2]AIB20909.1 Hypothetical protein BSPT1_I0814 [Brucella suis bv. 2]